MSGSGLTIINNYWLEVTLKGNWHFPLPETQEIAPGGSMKFPFIKFTGTLTIPRTTVLNITDLSSKDMTIGEFSKKKFGLLYQCDGMTCALRYDDASKTPVTIEISEWGQVHITVSGDGDICLLDFCNIDIVKAKKVD